MQDISSRRKANQTCGGSALFDQWLDLGPMQAACLVMKSSLLCGGDRRSTEPTELSPVRAKYVLHRFCFFGGAFHILPSLHITRARKKKRKGSMSLVVSITERAVLDEGVSSLF